MTSPLSQADADLLRAAQTVRDALRLVVDLDADRLPLFDTERARFKVAVETLIMMRGDLDRFVNERIHDTSKFRIASRAFRIPLHRIDGDKPWWRRRWRGYAYGVSGDQIEERLLPYVAWQNGVDYVREPMR